MKTATEKMVETKKKRERNADIDTAVELANSHRNYEPTVVIAPVVVAPVPVEAETKPHKSEGGFFPGFFTGISCSAVVALLIWAINMMVVMVH